MDAGTVVRGVAIFALAVAVAVAGAAAVSRKHARAASDAGVAAVVVDAATDGDGGDGDGGSGGGDGGCGGGVRARKRLAAGAPLARHAAGDAAGAPNAAPPMTRAGAAAALGIAAHDAQVARARAASAASAAKRLAAAAARRTAAALGVENRVRTEATAAELAARLQREAGEAEAERQRQLSAGIAQPSVPLPAHHLMVPCPLGCGCFVRRGKDLVEHARNVHRLGPVQNEQGHALIVERAACADEARETASTTAAEFNTRFVTAGGAVANSSTVFRGNCASAPPPARLGAALVRVAAAAAAPVGRPPVLSSGEGAELRRAQGERYGTVQRAVDAGCPAVQFIDADGDGYFTVTTLITHSHETDAADLLPAHVRGSRQLVAGYVDAHHGNIGAAWATYERDLVARTGYAVPMTEVKFRNIAARNASRGRSSSQLVPEILALLRLAETNPDLWRLVRFIQVVGRR